MFAFINGTSSFTLTSADFVGNLNAHITVVQSLQLSQYQRRFLLLTEQPVSVSQKARFVIVLVRLDLEYKCCSLQIVSVSDGGNHGHGHSQ